MNLNDSNKLGVYHITADSTNYETARSNFFNFLVEDLDDLVYPQFSYDGAVDGHNEENQYVTRRGGRNGQEMIKLSVTKMFVPHFKVSPIEIRRGNSTVKFADTPSWDSGTLECQDFLGLETKNILMAWQALVYDVISDTQGRADDWVDEDGISHKGYKRDCTLVEYNPQGEMVRYWNLIGCWISNITESEFEKSTTGARTISCTIEYDRAEMHQPDGKFATAI